MGEIARDTLEMVAYANAPSALGAGGLTVGVAALPGAEAAYEVTASIGPPDPPFRFRIVLADHLWASPNYEGLAKLAMDRLQVKVPTPRGERPAVAVSALVDLAAETVEQENGRVSARLASEMLSASAHEEAAFVLGAFAMRENAGTFSDTRPILCRMTAHLALARALRAPSPPRPDGELARLIQTTLIGRQSEAMEGIARLRKGRITPGERAWLVALAMRNTGDWRLVANPARATLVERIEYVRALKRTQGGLKALEFLSRQRTKPATEWTRIGLAGVPSKQENGSSVEEGNVFAPTALDLELQEVASVLKVARLGAFEPTDDPAQALNAPSGRTVWQPDAADQGPRVIDRGLRAGFAQRQILFAAERTEMHLEEMLGAPEAAAEFRAQATTRLGKLTLFPLLQEVWNRRVVRQRPGGPPPPMDKDRGRCLVALELLRQRPEVVAAYYWDELNTQCSRARVENTLVDPKLWFTTGLPLGTLYDLDHRSYIPAFGLGAPAIEGLARLAPYDQTVMYWRMSRHPLEEKITQAEFDEIYGPVVAYDAKAQRARATRVDVPDPQFVAAAKQACAANADQCLRMANELVDRGADEEAVRAYERAVRSARDRVAVSTSTRWLVQHYFEAGRDARALEVARMSAEVHSAAGLDILGQLTERMGRYEEAEGAYVALAAAYRDEAYRLPAFYFRHERRVGDGRFRAQAAAAEKELFPAGLKRASIADLRALEARNGPSGAARTGFPFMEEPSKGQKALGLRMGDTILVLDGYRVFNEQQYACVLWLSDGPEVTMIVLRDGKDFVELAGKMERRRYGPRQGAKAAKASSG